MTPYELYSDKETCIEELFKIRELFGLRTSNIDDFEIMAIKLAEMLCYCPDDEFLPSNETCRVATGICDWPETCTGHHPNCPDDGVKAVGSLCREITGICDIPEVCDGTNKTCPTNKWP